MAKQDVTRRPFNHIGDLAQAILDQIPTDQDESKHMIPVADVRERITEIRDRAYGYDARLKVRVDAQGRRSIKPAPETKGGV